MFDMDGAVEEVIESIDGSEAMGTGMPRSVSLDFLNQIIEACRSRRDAIKADAKNEGAESDDEDEAEDDSDED